MEQRQPSDTPPSARLELRSGRCDRPQDRPELGGGDSERRDRHGQPLVGLRSNRPLADVHGNGHRSARHGHMERERDCRRRRRRRHDRRERPVPCARRRANPSTVTVRAASTASPTSTGSSSVTILPLPSISSVSPSPVSVGNFTLTVNGAGFTAGSMVSFDGADCRRRCCPPHN